MSIAVLLSTQPKWCKKICHKIGENADGTPIYEKRVEVRKTKPKLETPFKVYIYMTKKGNNFLGDGEKDWFVSYNFTMAGKVIGEFICDFIRTEKEIACGLVDVILENASCVNAEDLIKYADGNFLYSWHISNLVIYDEPKELSEFEKSWYDINDNWHDIRPCECGKHCEHEYFDYSENLCACDIDYSGDNCPYTKITRPPQSWCYVEELSV